MKKILLIILFLVLTTSLGMAAEESTYAKGKVIVKFKEDKVQPDTLINSVSVKSSGMKVLSTSSFKINKLIKQRAPISSISPQSISRVSGRKVIDLTAILKKMDSFYTIEFDESIPVEDVINSYKDSDLVEFVEPDYIYKIKAVPVSNPNDPKYQDNTQYGLPGISASGGWTNAEANYSPVVAVLDTGVDYNHVDLAANMVTGYDFYDNDSDPMDYHGHGTHVAGIIAAVFNNGVGGTGIATNAKIMPLKVFNDSGLGTGSTIMNAIDFAIYHSKDNNVDIINMSLGGSYSASMETAADAAEAAGIILFAAAGNDNKSTIDYPAAFSSVIAVGALATNLVNRASPIDWGVDQGSHYGPELELMAPGTGIYSTYVGNSYGYLTGTSQATPYAAGLAALLKQTYPLITGSQIRTQLQNTCDDLGSVGWDNLTGYGRINALAALQYADINPPQVTINFFNVEEITLKVGDLSDVPSIDLVIRDVSNNPVVSTNLTSANITFDEGFYKYYSFDISPALAVGTYNVSVSAVDSLGNSINMTSIGTMNVSLDNQAPVVVLFSYSLNNIELRVEEDSGISSLGLIVRDSNNRAVVSSNLTNSNISSNVGSYTYYDYLVDPPLQNGSYDVWVFASDSVGNTLNVTNIGSFQIAVGFQMYGPTDASPGLLGAPNPYDPSSGSLQFGFRLSRIADSVELKIFDLAGREIYSTHQESSIESDSDKKYYYEYTWDGRSSGEYVKNGVYFAIVKASYGGQEIVQKFRFAVLR